MPTEILTNSNTAQVAQEKWDDECHRAYIGELKAKWLMSPEAVNGGSALVVKEDAAKKDGDAFTIRYASAQAGGTVRGNATGAGNEGSMSFYAQKFVVDNIRTLHKIKDVHMSQKRVSFSIKEEMKYALTTKHAEVLDDDIIAMLCDATTGRVRGRYLYGAADSNWNATHATALTAVDNTVDKLTGDMISIAKRKAKTLGTGVSQKIKPAKLTSKGLDAEYRYLFLGHSYAIRDLVNLDAAFIQRQLLTPPAARTSIYYTGADFKGSWDGVLIYEYDRLPLVSSTIQCAHNLLLGAKAGVVCWGQRSKFTDDTVASAANDYGHDYGAELHDIRNKLTVGSGNNLKTIYNDGTNSHDYGLVNCFSAAVAD